MTKYTDHEIVAAASAAAFGRGNVGDLKYFTDFINSLPDPQPADEWEVCTADELQYGDMYRAESSSRDIAYKQPITRCAIVGGWIEIQHEDGMKSTARIADNTFYRIPAPVQHPDPLEYPAIIDLHTTGDEVFDYAVWDAEDFYLCYTHEGEFMRVAEPSEITKFTPAKVVEDDR